MREIRLHCFFTVWGYVPLECFKIRPSKLGGISTMFSFKHACTMYMYMYFNDLCIFFVFTCTM